MPSHTTVDLSLGKSFSEGKYAISATALNVANRRVQLDNSLTFGGFHWNEPRQIYGEFRYRFHLLGWAAWGAAHSHAGPAAPGRRSTVIET